MTRSRLGVCVMPLENRRETFIALATAADRLGYDGFFLPETWAFDIPIVLAEVALQTERLQVGTGILGVWNRSPATIAMLATTLAALSGGRFVLGLGASTPQLTEGLHDVPFSAPVARMRRTVTQVRALLRGDRIPLATTTHARPLKLNVAPVPDLPIYLAALGDPSVRLAGEVADGWIPFLYPQRWLAYGIERLREGAIRGGHPDHLPLVAPAIPTVVAPDAAQARAGAAWFVAFYLTSMGTFYRDSLVRQGFGKEVEAVLAANAPRLQGAVPPDAEELLEQLVVFGTPTEACLRLQRWYAAGAAFPSLLLRPGLTREEIEFTLDAFRPILEGRA